MIITTEALNEIRAYPIGYQLKRLRCIYGYSQVEFAKAIKCTQSSVSRWESDNIVPNGRHLEKIIQLFDLPGDFFASAEIQRVKLSQGKKKQ